MCFEALALERPKSGIQGGIRTTASVIYYPVRDGAIVHVLMTHFPQPHPSRRAARVQLGDSVLAAIRLEDGRRTRAKLQSVSVTGGLLHLAQSLAQGDFVEVA